MSSIADSTVLLIGAGGLGCPTLVGLLSGGVGRVIVCDDDEVDEGNLHRQILFFDDSVGQPKLDALRVGARRLKLPEGRIEIVRQRFLPQTAAELAGCADLVIEGADNFATKFLAADTCALAEKPIIHGAALGWNATVWAVGPGGKPCYRCLFEDLPAEDQRPNCNTAGVMGPVVGFAGGLMAELALRVLCGDPSFGAILTYDGLGDRLRSVPVNCRPACPLCGQPRQISDIDEARYLA